MVGGGAGARSSRRERFRAAEGRRLLAGLIGSVAIHGSLGVALLDLEAPLPDPPPAELELVILPPPDEPSEVAPPPSVELPPPPPPVQRPGVPVLPEPESERPPAPEFIPHDTPPLLVNADEVRQALHDSYPEELRVEGVEGLVVLWLYVDARGEVMRLRLQRSSGHQEFDALARDVAKLMKYRPALNRSFPVGVWVSQPIRFTVERDAGLAGSRTSG